MTAANTMVSAPTVLTGRKAQLARGAWIILTAIILIAYTVGIPSIYSQALNISPETAVQMDQLNLPHSFPAIFLVGVDTLAMLGFVAVAFILFWQRGSDWMALFVGMMLMLTGVVYSHPTYNPVIPLWLIAGLVALGEIFQVTFLLIFPNGKFVPRTSWVMLIPLVIWRPLMWLIRTSCDGSEMPSRLTRYTSLGWNGRRSYRYFHTQFKDFRFRV